MNLSVPENLISKENFIFNCNSDIKIKKGFLNSLINELLKLTKKGQLNISENTENSIKTFFLELNDPESVKYDAGIVFSLDPFNLAINKFYLAIDDVTLDIKGNYFSDPSSMDSKIIVNVSEYNKIIDFIINKYSKNAIYAIEYLNQNPDIYDYSFNNLLNLISEPHEVNDKNLEFIISFDNKEFKIGGYNISQIIQYFYQFTFNEALKYIKNKIDYKEEILEIMPFLKNKPEILDNLIKNANIQTIPQVK